MEMQIAGMLFGAAAIAVAPHALVATAEALRRKGWTRRFRPRQPGRLGNS